MRIFHAAVMLRALAAPIGASACDLEAMGFGRFSPFQSSWAPPPETQPETRTVATALAVDSGLAKARDFAQEMYGVSYTPPPQEDVGPARTN